MNIKLCELAVTVRYLCILSKYTCSCNSLFEKNDINHSINDVLINLTFYQIALFIQETESMTVQEIYMTTSITNFLSRRTNTLLITTPKLDSQDVLLERYWKSAKDPRETTLFISASCLTSNLEISIQLLEIQFKNTLKLLDNLSRMTKPRLLYFILSNKIDRTERIMGLLHYAWTIKFLDITVMQFLPTNEQCRSHLFYIMYNPFTNKYSNECFSSNSVIFPNKLRNMEQYPLKISLLNRYPALNFDRDELLNAVNINGSDFGIASVLSETMNFSLELVTPLTNDYSELIMKNGTRCLLDLLEEGEIDFSGNLIFLHVAYNIDDALFGGRGLVVWFDDLVALVPIFATKTWYVQYKSILLVLSMFSPVIIIYVFARSYKFDDRFWLPHHIFRVLLGETVPRIPSKFVERILFFSLFILSQYYSVELYAKLTEININEIDEGPFRTLEDLEKHDVVLVSQLNYNNVTFQGDDPILQKLKSKVEVVNHINDCPSRMITDKKVICLIDKSIALNFISINGQDPEFRIKIMDHVFWTGPKGILFTESSPYVVEFDRILARIGEGALWKRYDIDKKVTGHERFQKFTDDHLLRNKLIIIWLLGSAGSYVVFISELVVKSFSNK